jgi:hypothetical protein
VPTMEPAISPLHLDELLQWRDWPVVSIYMPTHRAGPDIRQDPIRLKNALREAEDRAMQAGLSRLQAGRLLRPGWDLIDDSLFWLHQGEGLALFLANPRHEVQRLAFPVPERLVVADRPHVKPLLELLTGDGRFHVLAVSQKEVRLLEASRDGARVVESTHIPASLHEALRYDVVQMQVQMHSIPLPGGSPRAGHSIFHGHGEGTQAFHKTQVTGFLRQVARGVEMKLKDPRAPLVFAGAEWIFGVYRSVSAWRGLLDVFVPGSPEGLGPAELQREAWKIIEPRFRQARHDAGRRFRELAGTGQTVTEITDVLRAAHDGLIDTLFAARDEEVWGWYHPASRRVLLGRDLPGEALGGGEDLVDRAAVETAERQGTVYLEDRGRMPGDSPVAAVLRYPAAVEGPDSTR